MALTPAQIEGEKAWQQLQRRLNGLQAGTSRRAVHMLQLGDSHTAGPWMGARLRQLLRDRYGDAGPGLLPPGRVASHAPSTLPLWHSSGWLAQPEPPGQTGLAPALGALVGYGERAYQTLGFDLESLRVPGRLHIYYQGAAEPGRRPGLFADGVELSPSQEPAGGRAVFDLPAGSAGLSLLARADAREFRLQGLALTYATPGISFSTVGQNGARFDVLRSWDGDTVRAQMRDLAPDLVIVAFGVNDAVSPGFSETRTAQQIQRMGEWLRRHAPQAAVLLILPPHAPRHGAEVHRQLHAVRQSLHQTARAHCWRTWDWSALTGRQCSGTCITESGQPFFSADGIHLTKAGYLWSAERLFADLVAFSPPACRGSANAGTIPGGRS